MAVLEKEDFWGGKLSKSTPVIKFNPEFDDSELSEVDHKLIVTQACLSGKASGRNLVEVTATDFQGNECTYCIVSLREGSVEMCSLNLSFNPPATFKLIEGSGPVHLAGSHMQSLTEEEKDTDDESEEESDEEVAPTLNGPIKQKKRPLPASKPKGPPSKVAKVAKEESEEEESDDEEESDEDEEEEKVSAVKQESKKPSKYLENEAEEDESDKEDEEVSDEEEDNDDDESEEDESDEEESDEEDENEVTATLTGKKKQAAKLTNGVAPKKVAGKAGKNTPQPTPQPKAPRQKTQKTPQTKTPQTKTPQAKAPQAKAPQAKTPQDIEEIKQALIKSPALPKKFDKFQNFMRSSYKITGIDSVKELWDFVQKNKK